MPRLASSILVASLLLATVACDPSPESYCRQRGEAWARAFPEEAANDPKHGFMESCPDVIRKEQQDDPAYWKLRVRCLRENIRDDQTGKAATDAYLALSACERRR